MNKPTTNKHTMNKELLFLGLDVHAKSLTLALAEGGGGEARLYGTMPNDLHAVEKVFAKLKTAHPGAALRVCHEAGPTGFVLARRCAQLRIDCQVVAPSLIPTRRRRGLHVAIDDHSRLAFAALLPDEKIPSVLQALHQAVGFYKAHGIRIQRLLTDRGSTYRSKLFASACQQLGLKHRF